MVPMGRSCEFILQGACRAAMPGIASGAQRGRWARKTALRIAFPASSVRRARLTMHGIAHAHPPAEETGNTIPWVPSVRFTPLGPHINSPAE